MSAHRTSSDLPGATRRARWRTLGTALALAVAGLSPALAMAGPGAASAQAAAGPECVTKGLSTTCYFGYTGTTQYWPVPQLVNAATFEVVGAAGGSGAAIRSAPGGVGGGVRATVALSGAVVEINVGGRGSDFTGQGGWNGGGNGAGSSAMGGGGGGASDISVGGARLLVGAGGGGSGSSAVGYAGPVAPGAGGAGGGTGIVTSGPSVGPGRPGGDEPDPQPEGAKGGRGGDTAGGSGGDASSSRSGVCGGFPGISQPGAAGRLGVGGSGGHFVNVAGKDCYELRGWGGGGGGGYTGGGGGAAGAFNGAGGGGGSSYGPAGSTTLKGQPSAHGYVRVTYLMSASGWLDQGISASSDPVVIKRGGDANIVDLFWLDANRQAWHRSYTDGVPSADDYLGGILYQGSSLAAVSTGPNRIDVFARGTESALWQTTFNGTGWSGWAPRSAENQLASSPTAASWGPGRIDVFAQAPGNTLVQFWGDNLVPSNQHNLGGTVLGPPAAVSWGDNRIDIVYPSSGLPGITDTGWKVWDPTRGGWQAEQRIAVDSWASGPAITSAAPGRLEIAWAAESGPWRTGRYSEDQAGWTLGGIDKPPGASDRARPSLTTRGSLTYYAGRGGTTHNVWMQVF